jgi:hypothetical protein
VRRRTEQFIDSTDQVIPHYASMRSKKSPVQDEFHPQKAVIQLSAYFDVFLTVHHSIELFQ